MYLEFLDKENKLFIVNLDRVNRIINVNGMRFPDGKQLPGVMCIFSKDEAVVGYGYTTTEIMQRMKAWEDRIK